MLKWIVLIAVGYFLYRMFGNDLRRKLAKDAEAEKVDQAEMDRKVAAGEMVKDPLCGTFVAVDGDIKVRDGEKVYHFCSYDCRDRFLQQLREGGRSIPEKTE